MEWTLYQGLNALEISLYTIGCYQCSSGAQSDNRHLQLGMVQTLGQRVSNYRHEMN